MFRHLATSSGACLHRLASWFDSPAGRRLLQEQAIHFTEHTRRFHGDTLLWVGCHTPVLDTVRGCMIRNHFLLELPGAPAAADVKTDSPEPLNNSPERLDNSPERLVNSPERLINSPDAVENEVSRFQSNLQEIPLPNNSLDALVLHHGLEAAPDPRTAIRESARVLADGGRLVICGFNPLSLWGLRGAYARVFGDSFSGLRLVSPFRLIDWLTVLGFETETVRYIAYSLPFGGATSEARLWRGTRELLSRHQVPLGGVYMLSAVKQALAQRPDWPAEAVRADKLAPVAYPKLSAWNRFERPG